MYIRDFLQGRRVWFETLLHRPVPTATRFAHLGENEIQLLAVNLEHGRA